MVVAVAGFLDGEPHPPAEEDSSPPRQSPSARFCGVASENSQGAVGELLGRLLVFAIVALVESYSLAGQNFKTRILGRNLVPQKKF